MRLRVPLLLVLGLYALHQDSWFWRRSAPLAFGFVPAGLWYHALYCIACAILMAILVKRAWPEDLDGA